MMTSIRQRAYSLWKDIGERAVWTFVQTFVAVEGFDTFLGELLNGRLNLAWFNTAKLAALAALLAVVKGYLASKVPNPEPGPSTAALPEPTVTA